MQIQAEAYGLMNGWMNYLSLLLAFRLAKMPFPPFRGMLAAGLGTGYAFAALMAGEEFQGVWALAGIALGMSFVAAGKRCMALWPMVFAGGWLLAGIMDFLVCRGVMPIAALAVSSVCGLVFSWGMERMIPRGGGKFRLQMVCQGKRVHVPAIRDSGNLLSDPVTGLSVIVAPVKALPGLLPPGADLQRLDGLQKGFRLMPIKTAAGSRLAFCLHPREVMISQGRKKWRVDAILALSDFDAPWALLPDSLFMQKEDGINAGL